MSTARASGPSERSQARRRTDSWNAVALESIDFGPPRWRGDRGRRLRGRARTLGFADRRAAGLRSRRGIFRRRSVTLATLPTASVVR